VDRCAAAVHVCPSTAADAEQSNNMNNEQVNLLLVEDNHCSERISGIWQWFATEKKH
jgi:hypothetical protein